MNSFHIILNNTSTQMLINCISAGDFLIARSVCMQFGLFYASKPIVFRKTKDPILDWPVAAGSPYRQRWGHESAVRHVHSQQKGLTAAIGSAPDPSAWMRPLRAGGQ